MKRETYYKKPLKALYKLALGYFHKYIVLRDKRQCYTCPKKSDGIMYCSHFVHGGTRGMTYWLDFDERNNHCGCYSCNMVKSGNLNVYAENLERDYGFGIIQELNALKWKKDEWSKDDLINIIEDCKEKIKRYKKNK
jgi:hypothetical protein